MVALREVLADFGFSVDQRALDGADRGVQRLTAGLRAVSGVIGGGALALGIQRVFGFAAEVATATDELAKFGEATELSATSVAEWDQALQDAGLQLSQGRQGVRTVTKAIGEATLGNKEYGRALRLLGVDVEGVSSGQVALNDAITQAVLGLEGIENPARRAAIAERLFGEAAGGFVRVAQGGAAALAATREEFARLNPDFAAFVAQSQEAAVALDGWRKATNALRGRLAAALLPTLTRLIRLGDRVVRFFLDTSRGTAILQVGLVALAAVAAAAAAAILVAFAPVLLPVLAIAAVITALVLIAEDLFQLFTGGRSAIGGLIDEFLGAGTAQKLVNDLRAAWVALFPVLRRLGGRVRGFFGIVRFGLRVLTTIWRTQIRVWTFLIETWVRVVRGLWRGLTGAFAAVVRGVRAAWDGLIRGLTTALDGLRVAWAAVTGAFRRAFGAVVGVVDDVVERVREAIGLVVDLAERAAGILEGGGARLGREAARVILEQRTQAVRSAVVAASPGGGAAGAVGASVAITNAPTINVSSASSDPRAVARSVVDEMDRREQDSLRRARDRLRR